MEIADAGPSRASITHATHFQRNLPLSSTSPFCQSETVVSAFYSLRPQGIISEPLKTTTNMADTAPEKKVKLEREYTRC